MKTVKEFLAATDPEIYKVCTGERRRQEEGIELIASENVVAPAVLAAMDSVLTNKPKGKLTQKVNPEIKVSVEGGILKVERPTDEKEHRALHGLYRSLIHNMVVGVSERYKKELVLVGISYRVANTGQLLDL